MKRAVVLSGFDADHWTSRWQQGQVPSVLPYGMEHLHGTGWHLQIPRPPVQRTHLARKAISMSSNRLGYPWTQAVQQVRAASRADAVIGVLEPHIFAAAQLRRTRVPAYLQTPLAALPCWAGETLRDGTIEERRNVKRLMGPLDRIYVLSANQVEIFLHHGFRDDQLREVSFGIDTEFYTPGNPQDRDIDVLAVGLDRGRDYGTLFKAARGLPLTVVVVAKKNNIAHLEVPSNVKFVGTVDHQAYRALVRRAKTVAIPTHDYAYPTGQSVALESSAAGAPIIVTHTEAMGQYFTDGVDAAMPRVHDSAHWRDTLMDLHRDKALRDEMSQRARENVLRNYSTKNLWTEISADLAELVGGVKASKQHGVRRQVVGRRILSGSGSRVGVGVGC